VSKTKIHIVIGDAHVAPNENYSRFTALGNLVNAYRPDVLINIGDWFDLPSLCHYDSGLASFNSRSLYDDLNAGVVGHALLGATIRRAKKRLPRFVSLEGNHDYRLTKAINRNPTQLKSTYGHHSFNWQRNGWEYYPYVGDTPAIVGIDGISYTHFVPTNGTSRAMSGINLASNIVNHTMRTTVVGHSHHFDISRKVAIDGTPIWGVVCGSFIERDSATFRYAGTGTKNWWSGIVVLKGVENGTFEDFEAISLDTLKKEYL